LKNKSAVMANSPKPRQSGDFLYQNTKFQKLSKNTCIGIVECGIIRIAIHSSKFDIVGGDFVGGR